MLTGRILNENGRENVECYAAGVAGGLPLGTLATEPAGKIRGLYWALPCSDNGGLSVTGFSYQMATNNTKPRPDAVKVIVIEDVTNGGSYKMAIVPDTYTISDFVTAACAGCDPLPDTTVITPILLTDSDCYIAPPAAGVCSYLEALVVPALTGANTTYTATPYGTTADGTVIVFSPATSTGTTVALLAANMQTNWASELGTGTFTATGNVINYTSTNGAQLSFSIAQS